MLFIRERKQVIPRVEMFSLPSRPVPSPCDSPILDYILRDIQTAGVSAGESAGVSAGESAGVSAGESAGIFPAALSQKSRG